MRFIFSITEVDRESLIKYPYAALDGSLTILVNDSVFFSEEGVSLLELAIHITGWLSAINTNTYLDFDYSADDYQENPILHFTRIDNQHYAIYSAWVNSKAEIILELAEITRCFSAFLQELNTTIQQAYGVGFADIPLFKLAAKPKEIPVANSQSFSLKELLKRLWP
jgi:hypothetical protein